jgi:superoxide dismutase
MVEKSVKERVLEELFDTFLKEYLFNVVDILPNSYRAKQLTSKDALQIALVFDFETKFLKQPFMKAINLTEQLTRKEFMDNFRTIFKEQFDSVERVTEERVRKECEETYGVQKYKELLERHNELVDELNKFTNPNVKYDDKIRADQTKKIFEEIEKNSSPYFNTNEKFVDEQTGILIPIKFWENLKKKFER